MAKAKKKVETTRKPKAEAGEQMDLIDVTPENIKEIKKLLHPYKKFQAERIAALKRLPNGQIKFRCGGMIITLKPTDEKLIIKEEKTKDEPA